MFYNEALNYIRNIERAGSDYGIERMRELLTLLGEPDKELKFIHVAGTNGKGSVTAYLTSVLKEAGYKVGTYNSPSVFDYNERWLINAEPLSDDGVAKYLTVVKDSVENENVMRRAFMLEELKPTAFEIETAVAMLAFYDAECDVCVLETGLGGRWDATNVICEKELAVITPIGLDHCSILGDTLDKIASEKGAIINGDAVTCKQEKSIMHELENPYSLYDGVKKYLPCRLKICANAQIISSGIDGQIFRYDGKEYKISMLGKHQVDNAALAICAVQILREKHWQISEEALKKGLEKTTWRARLEIVKNAEKDFNIIVPQDKTLVFDGSHNPHGAKTLAETIKELFANKRIHLVLGILKDKDFNGICKLLAPLADRITCVTPPSSRALQKEELMKAVLSTCNACDAQEDIRSAVQNALKGDCDVVVLCGSLTLFGALNERRKQ